ncbi:TPA: carboxylating nicotinate-nucleotide diphosphorylase [Candidatus Latescibacteria bacterium]|nr:carboxylating nicotinate-nucleotide diphosphorylase [Candidatus Latescibacterota bacterium]
MTELKRKDIQPLIDVALSEDVGSGDITSNWTVPDSMTASADFVAKATGVVSGLQVAAWVFDTVDGSAAFESKVSDGERVHPGDLIATVSGPARGLLTGERTALNFLQRMSGVATLTCRYVKQTLGTDATILDTRKTIPGWRKLDKYAVAVGGGKNHRFGLFDMVLIKENHIEAADGIGPAVNGVRKHLNGNADYVKIEVEVKTLIELEEAMMAAVDWVMLDNMDVDTMVEAVQMVRNQGGGPLLEASGNVTLDRVKEIAGTGVDYISVGSLTHSATALDISMLFR